MQFIWPYVTLLTLCSQLLLFLGEKIHLFMSGSDSGCELAHLGQYQGKPPASSLFYLFNCRRKIYKYGTRHLGALGSLTPCCWVASFSPGFWYHVFKRWVSWRQGTVYPTSSDCQNIWGGKSTPTTDNSLCGRSRGVYSSQKLSSL